MKSLVQYINEQSNNKENKGEIKLYDFSSEYKGFKIIDCIEGKNKFTSLEDVFKHFKVKNDTYNLYNLRPTVKPYTLDELNRFSTLPDSGCFDYIIKSNKLVTMRNTSAVCKPVDKEKTLTNNLIIYIMLQEKYILVLPRLEMDYWDEGYDCIFDDDKSSDKYKESPLYTNLVKLYGQRDEIDYVYNLYHKNITGNKFICAYEHDTWD